MKKVKLLVLFMTLFSFIVSAEDYTDCAADNIVNGASRIWMNESNNTIKFVELKEPLSLRPDLMADWLKEILDANEKTAFVLYETTDDKLGDTHYRFKQTYNGYVVNHGVYYVHSRNGQIVSANGEFYPDVAININAIITTQDAIEVGKEHIGGEKWAWKEDAFPRPELQVVYANGTYHFAYKTDIYSYEPLAREWVFVDALNGEVIITFNQIHKNAVEGEAHCKYHGQQTIIVDSVGPTEYRLQDETRGLGVETYDLNTEGDFGFAVDFTDDDNIWDTTTDFDDAALDVHWSTENMYDYMLNVYNWDSYNNNGGVLLSYVHYGKGVANAFWDGVRMIFGDGNEANGGNYGPLTSIDIVGHEYMHGVTQFTAGLINNSEPAALNESYSDCFGVMLDYHVNPFTANYLMGDQAKLDGSAIRSMSNPNEYDHPDTYHGDFWEFADFGVQHMNAGVQNFWFYLLTQGGVGINDNGDDYTVDPIPMTDAGQILFRSLSTYLTPNSGYADARFYGILAAEDLFGDCSQEEMSVTDAWHAVGLGGYFDSSVIVDIAASSNENCELPSVVQFTNASVNVTSYNWDFGNGETSTEESPTATYNTEGTYTVTLITNGVDLCTGAQVDTLVLTDYITVSNTGGTVAPSCFPLSTSPVAEQGIFRFNYLDIINPTQGSTDNYRDYTCTHSTDIQEGILHPFIMETGKEEGEGEMMKIWADLDADGLFNNENELLYSSVVPALIHLGQMIIPNTDLHDQPLRLRIKSDLASNDISDPCNTVINGQVEDYAIIVSANDNQVPATDFTVSQTTVPVNSSVTFTDLTENLPESWYWEFPGGTPSTSTEQHPQVTYDVHGVYPVTLVTNNINGQSTEEKLEYINVPDVIINCEDDVSSASFGLFYDSGGPNGPYEEDENCSFLISPGCVENLTLEFTTLDILGNFDKFFIYDGVDASAPLLAEVTSGFTLPPPVVSNSGNLFIVYISDVINIDLDGWEANWHSTIVPTENPVADFSFPNNLETNMPIIFTDLSTEAPSSWSWDFGNGDSSIEQNPSYTYTTPGTYTVELTVGNCAASDVITYTIVVIETPTGVKELETEISIYPNPTIGNLVITNIGNEEYHEIEVRNVIGQVLKRIDTSEFTGDTYELNLSDYPTGVYTLGLKFNDNLSLYKKIVLYK